MSRPASGMGKTAIRKARITDLEGYLDSSDKELRKAEARIKEQAHELLALRRTLANVSWECDHAEPGFVGRILGLASVAIETDLRSLAGKEENGG